jgi:hypothetical protein
MEVCFLASGEKLTVLDQDAVDGKNAKTIKQTLSGKVGATRFRQRLFLEGGTEIPGDEVFAPAPLKVYLVVLDFLPLLNMIRLPPSVEITIRFRWKIC